MVVRRLASALLFLAGSASFAMAVAMPVDRYTLVPGSFQPGRQPDGNTVILDAPRGLIVFDTGRHAEQQQRILAIAAARKQPIVAIINSHWHLDHTGGNATLLKAFPGAQVYASNAIDGALAGFFPDSRRDAERYLAAGKASAEQAAEIRADLERVAHPQALRPTHPILQSGKFDIGGRTLDLHLARFAATEGDIWVLDGGLVMAGDLVVAMVPFLDTACPDGWRRALDEIASTDFRQLIPGHGAPMTRPQFLRWRGAFNALLDCSGSSQSRQICIDGWTSDAAEFIPQDERARVATMVGYYIDSRLRAPAAKRELYCHPLGGREAA